MRAENNGIICAFCGKTSDSTIAYSRWLCGRCRKEVGQGDTHENLSGFTMSDCCNAPAKPVQWICNICGKVNAVPADAVTEKERKKPFNGADYTGYEDSRRKVLEGIEFLKSLKKR